MTFFLFCRLIEKTVATGGADVDESGTVPVVESPSSQVNVKESNQLPNEVQNLISEAKVSMDDSLPEVEASISSITSSVLPFNA